MPLLSVVVPIYNAEKYLSQCIESVLHQSLKDIELILVDDGSNDSSGIICDRYGKMDDRVRVFHQLNRGKIMTRMKGVMESKSEFVTFVDADDFIDIISYEYALDDMKNDADMICFGIRRYWGDGNTVEEVVDFEEGDYNKNDIRSKLFKRLIWSNNGNCMDPSLCTKIIKKELLLRQYYKVKHLDIDYGEDVIVAYPIIKDITKLIIKKEIYYNHRRLCATPNKYYINDSAFFSKLYSLFDYLNVEFKNYINIKSQIEKFYINAINYRRIDLDWQIDLIRYVFPFDKVYYNDRIVLYGAGEIGITYYAQIKKIKYCNVVAWVDKNYKKIADNRITSPSNIFDLKWDKVVVAIKNDKAKREVISYLVGKNIDMNNIIN